MSGISALQTRQHLEQTCPGSGFPLISAVFCSLFYANVLMQAIDAGQPKATLCTRATRIACPRKRSTLLDVYLCGCIIPDTDGLWLALRKRG
jgi:hypothetical protein